MQWQSTPYVLLLFLAAVTAFLWALYGTIRIQREGRRLYVLSFIVLCVGVTIWSASYAVQLASQTLEAKLISYKILHIGAAVAPSAWLVFTLSYSGREEWLTPRTLGGLLVIPLALLLAFPTNPYSLVLTDVGLETHGSLVVLAAGHGPLYLLNLAYSYVVLLIGVWVIIRHTIGSATSIRRQSVLLVTGALVPLVLNVFDVLDAPPFGNIGVNLTPVSLSLSTILFGVAIFRYHILDVTPIAWDVVLSQMSDGVIVVDDEERIVDLNLAAEALVGQSDTVIGTEVSSRLPEYERLTGENPLLVSLEGAEENRIVQLRRSPLTRYGEMYGWVVLTQDVTLLERQRRELQEQNVRLDEFAKVVAHDLRNPLAVIDGYAGLAEQTGEKQHFEKIHKTVTRMNTFLEELLVLSQQGDTVTELRPVPLATVAEAVRAEITDERLHLTVHTAAVVMADENRLHQVIDNLLRNCCDHNDGDVTVQIGELSDGFYVEDDGIGIPSERREKVFEVGFSTRSAGSGFGLAIVHDIADAHGWSISVTESTTGGTRFEITGVDFVRSE